MFNEEGNRGSGNTVEATTTEINITTNEIAEDATNNVSKGKINVCSDARYSNVASAKTATATTDAATAVTSTDAATAVGATNGGLLLVQLMSLLMLQKNFMTKRLQKKNLKILMLRMKVN